MSIEALPPVEARHALPESILREIEAGVPVPHLALMVYGSQARGTADSGSDIDVLAVVTEQAGTYTAGRVTVTAYTPVHLHAMAQSSSLFILHLMCEGIVLSDPQNVLSHALDAYLPPGDYTSLRDELRSAAASLRVTDNLFRTHGHALTRLGIYLLRTTLYLDAAESGNPTFDAMAAAFASGHTAIVDACALRRNTSFTPADLGQVDQALGLLLETGDHTRLDTERDLQNLAIRLSTTSPKASALIANVLFGDRDIDYVGLALVPW